MQTQTSNTLHNAIMEAGGKDRPPMFAPDKDVPVTEVDACPNACKMWKAIERLKQGESINVQDLETNLYWEFGKFTSRDGESLESYYSRGKAIVNSLQPIYDQDPSMVAEDDEMSKDKEIDKLMTIGNVAGARENVDEHNMITDSLDMSYDREKVDQDDNDDDLSNERELLASLIEKLKCEIDDSKNRNKFLETSNKVLVEKEKAPDSDEVIRLEKESRSKLSDLIRPFDYEKLNNLCDLFIPQREKSSIQRYFSERINADLEQFHLCLKEEMVADLRYFNSLKLEVDSLKSQLETQKT
nr:hypothetical protein [Tanacetum cinerariifolium]